MKPPTVRQVLGLAVVIFVGVVVLIAVLAGCTLVLIRGDDNSVSDTGGRGNGLTLPENQPSLGERLKNLQQDH